MNLQEKETLRRYYSGLLIKQYHGKTRAAATIETTVAPFIEIADCFKKIIGSFNLETANGYMLNLIGNFLNISRNINNDFILTDDEEYRFIIKLKLINDLQVKSIKTINETITAFFNGDIMVFNHYDMTMTYWIRGISDNMRAILGKYPELLPTPSAVGVRIVWGINVFFGFIKDGDGNYSSPNRTGLIIDGIVREGETLADGDNIED